MEENNYFDYNGATPTAQQGDATEDNIIKRWLFPSMAEQGQFDRENYFVDKQNAFNEYMWNKTNEYNSPAAQMERGREAGLNMALLGGGIMGAGNATATPISGGQGTAGMNTQSASPTSLLGELGQGVNQLTSAGQILGKLFGFGKENKALLKQIDEETNKTAKEADLTKWQTIQLRRTMPLLIRKMKIDYREVEQNIENLKELNRVYKEQKRNIAQDTTLKNAETGQKLEETKNLQYKNAEEQFKKNFRDIFGIQLNESDMSMLVQAVLSGHGDAIINGIVQCFDTVLDHLGNKVKEPIKRPVKELMSAHERWIQTQKEKKSERVTKKEHKRFERALQTSWNYMGSEERAKYGYKFENFRQKMIKKRERKGYSGTW